MIYHPGLTTKHLTLGGRGMGGKQMKPTNQAKPNTARVLIKKYASLVNGKKKSQCMCFTTYKRRSIQLGICPHVPDTDDLANKNLNMKVTEKKLELQTGSWNNSEDKM